MYILCICCQLIAEVSTSELHVHVRIEDKVYILSFLFYTQLLQQCMYMLSLHIYAVQIMHLKFYIEYLTTCYLVVRDTSVYDKSSKILTHSCNNVAIVPLLNCL